MFAKNWISCRKILFLHSLHSNLIVPRFGLARLRTKMEMEMEIVSLRSLLVTQEYTGIFLVDLYFFCNYKDLYVL